MKDSTFSDAQQAFILKQGADRIPVAEICRRAGISQATDFNWKKKSEGLLPAEMRRLKQLEDENAKAKLREDLAPAMRPNDVWAMELASPPFGLSMTSSLRGARSGF